MTKTKVQNRVGQRASPLSFLQAQVLFMNKSDELVAIYLSENNILKIFNQKWFLSAICSVHVHCPSQHNSLSLFTSVHASINPTWRTPHLGLAPILRGIPQGKKMLNVFIYSILSHKRVLAFNSFLITRWILILYSIFIFYNFFLILKHNYLFLPFIQRIIF